MRDPHDFVEYSGLTLAQWEKALPFLTEAETLFVRYGFKKTTIEDICRAVGASKRTFYELFDNKIDIAMKLALHVISHMTNSRDDEIARTESAAEAFCLMVDAYFEVSREHPYFKVLLTDPDLLTAMSSFSIEFMDVPYIKLLQEILVRGVDNGEFRKLDPNHVSLMIAGMLDSLVFVLPEFMHLPGPLENQAMERELREFLLAAILKRSESVEQRINSLCRIGGPELKS